jgi:hypothetical protein
MKCIIGLKLKSLGEVKRLKSNYLVFKTYLQKILRNIVIPLIFFAGHYFSLRKFLAANKYKGD